MSTASGVALDTSDHSTPSPSNAPDPSQQSPTPNDSPTHHDENQTESAVPQSVTSEPVARPQNQGTQASHELDDFGLPIRVHQVPNTAQDEASEGDAGHASPVAAGSASYSDATRTEEPVPIKEKPERDLPPDSANVNTAEPSGRPEAQGITPASPTRAKPIDSGTPSKPRESVSKQRPAEVSEWSHQRLTQPGADHPESEESEQEPDEWMTMPALGEFDYYDDYGRLIARGAKEESDEAVYQGIGGAGRGYTRVQLDEDAQSATSLDEDTSYLFRETGGNSTGLVGEELRDSISQLQATKDLLNETQKIAYVGVVRLSIHGMNRDLASIATTKSTRKTMQKASDAMRKWGQATMSRIYAHMDIDAAEQIMIEQLAGHGVQPEDLIRPLMQNARVKNPMAEGEPKSSISSRTGDRLSAETDASELDSPPPYEAHETKEAPEVKTPSQMPTSDRIDIDLRWTVLCDLFLVLIANSAYDARSRTLLEKVGAALEVTWLQISRFEKRVTDSLEMQEQAEKENWDETDHMERRRKMALKRKYMIMGLATVGGGLVIGLSAGLLAPVIGAGLAAGLTTVGISGTSAFLGGVGGTALIASSATLGGSTIGMRASHRRTGAVSTFEYRPLHNNKKVNLIVTVAGWMTGKVDDVRLPFSTVDPIMGDIYSVLWEPEMLRSMGDTINILATEVCFSNRGFFK